MDASIQHVYREGNSTADLLSKLGMKYKGNGAVNHRTCRTLIQLLVADGHNIPNIRYGSN
ncbi:hypothetical protein FRX31_002385 [Thalictrum thalictroides]|uniref:Uncharacterized protein n=1 Tax=Thalictrum thalictroides TaxID=46969 RepID=A0A7J6XFZ6_THATH|nr:hypothetical protein FRX31_002385 [Thalictrum thalictroides]